MDLDNYYTFISRLWPILFQYCVFCFMNQKTKRILGLKTSLKISQIFASVKNFVCPSANKELFVILPREEFVRSTWCWLQAVSILHSENNALRTRCTQSQGY